MRVRVELSRPSAALVRAEAAGGPAAAGRGRACRASALATGGGYSGPLAYRQGKPMRPDVAAAFDRLAAAASRARDRVS